MDALFDLLVALAVIYVMYVLVRGSLDLADLPSGAVTDAMLTADREPADPWIEHDERRRRHQRLFGDS